MPSLAARPDITLVNVAVPVPGLGVLTYRVPDTLTAPPKGARVSVPLGTRLVVGVVAGQTDTPPTDPSKLRDIASVIDAAPFQIGRAHV